MIPVDDNRDKKNLDKYDKKKSEEELIEKHIEELNNELNGGLSDEDKESIRNILKFVGSVESKSRFSKFMTHIREIVINFVSYFVIYLALYGLFNGQITLVKPYYIVLFNIVIALYQSVFKKILDITFKTGKHKVTGVIMFYILSIVILCLSLDIIPGIKFSSFIFAGLYYLIAEIIYLLIKFYISRRMIEKMLK